MVLRVSYLAVALVLLSVDSSNIRVNAADCTEDEQAYNEANYAAVAQGIADTCGSDYCSSVCQTQLATSAGTLYDCTSTFDGNNYHENVSNQFPCTVTETTEGTCDDEVVGGSVSDVITNANLGDCGANDPCESECNAKLQDLVGELPDCTDSDGMNFYAYYQSLLDSCSEITTTEGTCDDETISVIGELIDNASLGDCVTNDPCESDCYAKIAYLVDELPVCSDASGYNYYANYQGLLDTCSGTTTSPSVTTAAPSTTTSPSTSTSSTTRAPSTSTSSTTTSGTHTTTKPSSSSTGSTTSSEASEEEETSESAASVAGSASASQGNGAASAGGSAVGSLIAAATLTLLAAHN